MQSRGRLVWALIGILFLANGVKLQDYEEDFAIGGYYRDSAPEILLTPGTPGPLEISLGDDLYSRCSTRDRASYTFRWIRRQQDQRTEELSSTAMLVMTQIRQEDVQDPIYCEVTRDSDGQTFEELLNVRMAFRTAQPVIGAVKLTIRSLPAEDLSQGRIMRQCLFEGTVPDANEAYDFRWLDHNGRVVTNGDSLILMLDNLVDLGNYTCEATQRQTGMIYQAKYHVTRSARSQASYEYSRPRRQEDTRYVVEIQPVTEEILVGRAYEMVCSVTPTPDRPVSFRWYHNNQIVSEDSRLRLSALSYPDIGRYVCRAEWTPANSRAGPIAANSTTELNLALTRDVGIEMSPPPGSILVTLPGEMRELHCEFETRNPQGVRWFFEGEVLEFHPTLNITGRVHRMDRMRVSIITLREVEMAHAGTYECRVGNDIKQTHVIVRDESGLEINPESDRVDEGMSVEFHCRAHGASENVNREMQWFYRPFYGGAMVPLDVNTPSGFMRQDDPYASHTSFISKLHVRKSDEGEYICRLPSQNAEVVGRLYVATRTAYRVVITPAIIKVRVNQLIELECYVSDEEGRVVIAQPRFRLRQPEIVFQTDSIGDNRARIRIPNGLSAEYNGTQVECFTDEAGNTATAVIIIESACPQGYRRCRTGQCLPAGRFCDGVPDCTDRSDEDPLFCDACDPIVKKCEYHQDRAPVKKNYMVHWECDGEDDCGNQYDEQSCPNPEVARCDGSMFSCQAGNRQIPLAYVCDKDQDCQYGEDERNCVAPSIQATEQYRFPVRIGSQVTLTCRVTGFPAPRVIWRFNWGCLPDDQTGRFRLSSRVQDCSAPMPTVISTLTITNIHHGDDGIYNCEGLAGGTRAMSNDYFVMLEN